MTVQKQCNAHHYRRTRLALGMASVILLSVANTSVAENKILHLDIQAQIIGTALMELGQRAGVQIIFPLRYWSKRKIADP